MPNSITAVKALLAVISLSIVYTAKVTTAMMAGAVKKMAPLIA